MEEYDEVSPGLGTISHVLSARPAGSPSLLPPILVSPPGETVSPWSTRCRQILRHSRALSTLHVATASEAYCSSKSHTDIAHQLCSAAFTLVLTQYRPPRPPEDFGRVGSGTRLRFWRSTAPPKVLRTSRSPPPLVRGLLQVTSLRPRRRDAFTGDRWSSEDTIHHQPDPSVRTRLTRAT